MSLSLMIENAPNWKAWFAKMNSKFDWNDLNLVHAICESGSLSGAARRLSVSHATVYRRLADVEDRFGVRLFDRRRGGYTPTPAGEEVASVASRIAEDVFQVERRLAGRDLRPSGIVRVTTTDTLFFGLLSSILDSFRQAYPEIALEVALSNEPFNLSRREADIAIRPASDPPESLIGRRIGQIAQAPYIRKDRFDAAAPDAVPWIGPDARMGYPPLQRWMERQGHDARCHYRIDSMLGMAAAIRDGAGAGVLPCYLGDGEPALRRLHPPIDDLATDLWILTHPDLRGIARMKAFSDHVAGAVRGSESSLAGLSRPDE